MLKIADWERAAGFCRDQQQNGKRIVFTNGVFDLLHRGHVEYLIEAKAQGDYLLIGVNDDASASLLDKGSGRPVNTLEDRMAVLAALECIDLVIPFREETPLGLISRLMPDVLVKGGDYTEKEVVGAGEVKEWGGEVVLIDFRQGYSSTEILERIRGTSSRAGSGL